MPKNEKIILAVSVVAAIGIIYLISQHAIGGASIVSNNPANNDLPLVAPVTPNPTSFVLPSGGYIPQSADNGGCGCTMPGAANATANFLPASATAFTDLVARSGVDPTSLNMTILAANEATDFFPQTSSLAQMILSGGPGAMP